MGERGVIELRTDDKMVCIYTHGYGHKMEQLVANALNSEGARNRYDDPCYLTKIIFCSLLHQTGSDLLGEHGWGLSPDAEIDTNYPNVVVNLDSRTVNGLSYKVFIERNLAK